MSNVIYLEKTDIGATLTTWVYCAMWQLNALEKTGQQGYIHWPRDRMRALQPYWDDAAFDRRANMFDWYFEQPHVAAPPPRGDVWQWEIARGSLLTDYNLYGAVADIKAFYQRNCRLNADVRARGAALAAKYSLDFPNLIGVTWRGTDCVTDGRPRLPIETYFPFIDDVLEKEPHLRIVCTAEEEGVLDALLRRYPQAFVISEFLSSAHGSLHNPERFSPVSGYERGMQPALMVWLFSQCAHYIKNRSSAACVASWLSTGRIVSLAHPENLGHGFDLTKAEINGQLVPLYR